MNQLKINYVIEDLTLWKVLNFQFANIIIFDID